MPDTVELREYVCPDCGQSAKSDGRFVAWCISCGYGADRYPQQPPGEPLRSALIRERAQLPGVLELSPQEWAAVDAELAPLCVAVAHRFLRKV